MHMHEARGVGLKHIDVYLTESFVNEYYNCRQDKDGFINKFWIDSSRPQSSNQYIDESCLNHKFSHKDKM